MIKTFKFESDFGTFNEPFIQPGLPAEDVKNEPMFFNSSFDYAYEHGGLITRNFIDAVTEVWGTHKEAVFDSRVHMLKTGWYPAIPGIHHDDIPRTRSDGQPDYANLTYKSRHIMGLVNGDICPTNFVVGNIKLKEVPLGQTVYGVWHQEIEKAIEAKTMLRVPAPSGKLIQFNWDAFHECTAAVKDGWRWFGRVTVETERKATNEIRRQVQVYLPMPMAGW